MLKSVFVTTCILLISATNVMAQGTGKREKAITGQAGGYAYCLQTSPGPGDCKYTSLQQCQAALSGTVGTCVKNNGAR
jgi:hypothetical protein